LKTGSNDRQSRLAESDCTCFLPPCQVKCPIHEEIQRSNILISLLPSDPEAASAQIIEIGNSLFQSNPFFPICGYVCGICELECSYAEHGGAIRRRLLKRFIAENYRNHLNEIETFPKGELAEVAIIGGGPAGLMAAFELARRGYRPSIYESDDLLGGAIRLIPHYRLPKNILEETLDAIVRVAGIKLHLNSPLGKQGFDLDRLRNEGAAAIFIAAGSPTPRILEYQGKLVAGQQLAGVMYGHSFLYELAHGAIPDGYLNHRRVIVVGGGNVAFDAARSARRLGALTRLICLESASGIGREKIPADPHEIESAVEEGIEIIHSRGVASINSDDGTFQSISAPLCKVVYDDKGFNPVFDPSDTIDIYADLLVIAVGQGPERCFLEHEGLLDENGKVAVDQLTLESLLHEGVFIGGDMLRIGYMVDAMSAGLEAAESIDRQIRGADLREGRGFKCLTADPPVRRSYRPGAELPRVLYGPYPDFNFHEAGFSLEEAISEARRCIACAPCASCEACLDAGIRVGIPGCEVDEDRCSGCGICTTACPFGAIYLKADGIKHISATDSLLCRGCGLCVPVCPVSARKLILNNGHDIK